jgi:hypothetical protein
VDGLSGQYTNRLIEGRVAFLEWTLKAEHARVRDGVDSFVIENGWIVAQTIHCFRKPGGVLFEIATDPPGFAIDETMEHLGSSLKLPPRLEQARPGIGTVVAAYQVTEGRGGYR